VHLSTFQKTALGTVVAATSLLAFTGCSSGEPAGGSTTAIAGPVSLETACAAGAAEGEVNYWSTSDPDDFAEEIAPFEQEYPDITVNYTNIVPADATQQLITELQAGHSLSADAFTMDLASAAPLLDAGVIADFDYGALGIDESHVTAEGDVRMFRVFRDLIGIAYNPQTTSEADLPKSWDDLLDPKWKGKVIVDPRGVYVGGLGAAWGEDEAVDWFGTFLDEAEPQVLMGSTASLQAVESDQALLSTSATASAVLQQQADGAPIDIAYLDVVTSQDKYGMLVSGAAHPNAAACFLGWWGGPEGQAQQLAVELKANDDAPADLPAGATLAFVTDPESQTVVTDTTVQLAELMAQ